MRKTVILIIVLAVCGFCESLAQTTGLFTYDGGYFVKDGNKWTEYRYKSKEGVWASYTQYDEEENYYNIKNSLNNVSVPKKSSNKFYIYKNNDWEPLYTTREVYDYFKDSSRKIYAYQGGYFVRDGNQWREYRPLEKQGLWASYEQYSEDENFFKVENSLSNVCVPKQSRNSFYLMKDGDWTKIYTTTEIYDRATLYDFTFYFDYHKGPGADGDLTKKDAPASLSIDRKGNGQITYGDERRDFTFKSMAISTVRGTDTVLGFRITIDGEKEYILMWDSFCMINMESICPYMNFNDCTNKGDIEKVVTLIRQKEYFR